MRCFGWCDLQPDVGHHERAPRVVDVDDPGGADGGGARVGDRGGRVVGVLVDLEEVLVSVAAERLVDLRDRALPPVQVGEHLHLRVGLAVLHLADVEDAQAPAGVGLGRSCRCWRHTSSGRRSESRSPS